MTDSSRTVDPRAREDLIGRAVRRLFGPVPEIEYLPPEGSTETEPPYESTEIRYWRVIDGQREYRHRGTFSALRCPRARNRIYRAAVDMLRFRARRMLMALLVLAAISLAAPLAIYLWPEMVQAAFERGALVLGIGCFSLLLAAYWRVWKATKASSVRTGLSYDEEPFLILAIAGIFSILVPVVMLELMLVAHNVYYPLMGPV